MSHPIKSQKHIPAMFEDLTILHKIKTLFKITDLKVQKERSRVEDLSHMNIQVQLGESQI